MPRLGISIILPKNHCMGHMVEALGVDKILKMFKGQNKLSKVISFSTRGVRLGGDYQKWSHLERTEVYF